MSPNVPPESRRRRLGALAAIVVVVLAVVARGRGGGPIPLAVAVKAATNGSFYHWRDFVEGRLRAEGWCALRRSRTLDYASPGEERRSPSGVYRRVGSARPTFEPRTDATGMEEGDDFLTKAAARLSGLDATLTPLGDGLWRGGGAVYALESRTARILAIEVPGERIEIDYPLALSSDLFEAPR